MPNINTIATKEMDILLEKKAARPSLYSDIVKYKGGYYLKRNQFYERLCPWEVLREAAKYEDKYKQPHHD